MLSYSKLFSVSQSPTVHFVDLWTPLVSCKSNWPISTQNTQMFLKQFVNENWISSYKYISLTVWTLWPELLVSKHPLLNNVINWACFHCTHHLGPRFLSSSESCSSPSVWARLAVQPYYNQQTLLNLLD